MHYFFYDFGQGTAEIVRNISSRDDLGEPNTREGTPSAPRVIMLGLLISPVLLGHVTSTATRATAKRVLHLLPFEIQNALLPGETMNVGLNEVAHEQLLLDVMYEQQDTNGHIGMLLRRQTDATSGWASSCTPILEIMDRHLDAEGQVWLNMRCVGRSRILEFRNEEERYDSALVETWVDAEEDTNSSLSASSDEISETYRVVSAAWRESQELRAALDVRLQEVGGEDDQSSELNAELQWASDATACQPLGETGSLQAAVQHKVATLLERGLDEAPAETLEQLHDLWGVESDAQLETQLASFVPFTLATSRERMRALMAESTHERLLFAKEHLGRQISRLRAENALYKAVAPPDASAGATE